MSYNWKKEEEEIRANYQYLYAYRDIDDDDEMWIADVDKGLLGLANCIRTVKVLEDGVIRYREYKRGAGEKTVNYEKLYRNHEIEWDEDEEYFNIKNSYIEDSY